MEEQSPPLNPVSSRLVEWILFSILVGLSITGPLADPDLWWHLTIGRWIVGHGELPESELWNRFGFGKPFVPYSWSFEIFVAILERLGELKGVLIAQMFLVAIIAIGVAWFFGRVAEDMFFGVLVAAVVTSGFVAQYTLRPQSIVWLLCAGLVWLSLEVREKGLSSSRLLGIGGLMILWANLHITTVIGIAILALLLFERGAPRRWLVPLGVGLAATCCTPHLGYEWIVFFSKADHPLGLRSVAEFGPGTILDYPVAILGTLVALLLLLLHSVPRSVPLPLLVLSGVFTLGGLAVVKFLPFALVLVGYSICAAWCHTKRAAPVGLMRNLVEGFGRLSRLTSLLSGAGLNFLLLSVIVVKCHRIISESPVAQTSVPEAAVDFMIKNNLPRPFMNTFGEGGYMMYRLSNQDGKLMAEDRVNIDGRTNINDPEIMVANQRALDGRLGWEGYLKRVDPETILWRNRSPLVAILLASGEWCRVYANGSSEFGHSVFLRRARAGSEGLPPCLRESTK
jgi:hypothetical protein